MTVDLYYDTRFPQKQEAVVVVILW